MISPPPLSLSLLIIFLICSHLVFNRSSLFLLFSILILLYNMDMKRHMLLYPFIFFWKGIEIIFFWIIYILNELLKAIFSDNKSREYYLKGAKILIVKNSPKINYCKKKIRIFIFPLFPSGSQYVPQIPIVFLNMFCIAAHFYPECFGKCCPPFTYIAGPKGRNSIHQNRTFYFGEHP